METLKNKIALVTGAGAGIGKSIAELFAKEGAKVVLADIENENIERVRAGIIEKGGNAVCFCLDISNAEKVTLLMKFILKTYGDLDILVNNAGIMDNFTPAGELSNELWEKVIGVNLNGAFYTCREAIEIFLKKQFGIIINIASIAGLYGGRAGAAYTTSKHGLIGLTKSIGYQYALKGIRCNAIAPGGVNTNIVNGSLSNPFGFDRMNAGTGNVPRTAEPLEIAELVLFLASEKSSFINGAVLTADGGWTAY